MDKNLILKLVQVVERAYDDLDNALTFVPIWDGDGSDTGHSLRASINRTLDDMEQMGPEVRTLIERLAVEGEPNTGWDLTDEHPELG
jgi:hypothetical protein